MKPFLIVLLVLSSLSVGVIGGWCAAKSQGNKSPSGPATADRKATKEEDMDTAKVYTLAAMSSAYFRLLDLRGGNVEGAIEALETSIDEHVMELAHYFEMDPAPLTGPKTRNGLHATIKDVQGYRAKYPRKTRPDFDVFIASQLSELSLKLQ